MRIFNIRNAMLFFFGLLLVGCAGNIRTSEGLYGDSPGNLKDSDEKSLISFEVVGHDAEDIRFAVKKAAGLDGLVIDVERKNMLSGYGMSSGPESMRCPNAKGYAFAVFFEKKSSKSTKVTVAVDAMGYCFMESSPAHFVAQKLMSNTNKILMTYE